MRSWLDWTYLLRHAGAVAHVRHRDRHPLQLAEQGGQLLQHAVGRVLRRAVRLEQLGDSNVTTEREVPAAAIGALPNWPFLGVSAACLRAFAGAHKALLVDATTEDVCERVAELAFRQDAEGWPAQKTEAWKFARASALTASDVARVLEGGDARGKVLRQKQRVRKEEESLRQKQRVRKEEESMTPSTETKRDARRERRRRAPTSAAIRHGNEFEAEALAHYERTHGTTCLTFGLKIHDDHYWLGASPDGVHPSGRVVEIKCPYSRAVVPRARAMEHYAQIQTSLEVFDLEFCDFVQYKPPGRGKGRSGDPDRAEYLVETVPRNREWFARAFDELRAFALALPSP